MKCTARLREEATRCSYGIGCIKGVFLRSVGGLVRKFPVWVGRDTGTQASAHRCASEGTYLYDVEVGGGWGGVPKKQMK